ncbi:helix-turn-helix domain-containing protein [Luteimicrobium sp. NPDC057192]|uniref:helix-turn-helix domain-containing protein n=1 Tax=Luteimicrobium sp. NPDC057192 TaxID=3346042 RepID=UPI00363E6ED1
MDGLLDRAVRLLSAFDDDGAPLTPTELAGRAGLATSTAHRIATDLERLGLLARTSSGGYVPGTTLWALGERAPVATRLREAALPHLRRLHELTGAETHVTVLDPAAEGSARLRCVVRVRGVEPDDGQPEHEGADSDAALSAVAVALGLTGPVGARSTELTLVRAEDGTLALAAPVPEVDGLPSAAVGLVVGPGDDADAAARRAGPLVVAASVAVARDVSAEDGAAGARLVVSGGGPTG